ncbi:MAG: outer membrane lipoprotein carrier protein LolA [Holophagaceae bacterium]|uniref:Outer membrane lipoprotein carrier protein LolA n=1 Tax=Candidatus Geothrix skivensis TaxID=2954439 RepID=A0A9D7SJ27_9BACT|nr:outer membrane lipoprotein carrier protein LolA [Candidatus Geothrix skivensis]
MLPKALALLLCVLSLGAQTPPPLREVVERFDAAQAQVQTLQCPFTLTLRRALLKTPSTTRGTLYLQGSDFAHFAFQPPEDLILHLTPKALISYSPEAKEGELMKIGFIKNSDRKFLGLGQKLSYLADYFQIALSETRDVPNTWHLALAPRTLSLRKRLLALNLWVDKETWLPRQIQWIERSGDSWLLELGSLRINQPLPASVKDFRLPEGIPLRSEFSFFATRKK